MPDTKHINKDLTRREALRLAGKAAAAGFMFPLLGEKLFARPKQPNIIFILSDDHRWDALGSMGHPFVQTPNLDRLAKEGVRFSNAFVTTSLCSPSRASFLTGQYAHTHGVQNNLTPWQNSNVTFLELVKKRGYDTAFIGKWHMPGKLPELRGVDRFITFTAQGGQGQYYNCPLIIDGEEVPSRKPYITEELTDHALEFIEKKRENPFCLYLSHKAVHHQFLPPPELDGMYDDVPLNLPEESDSWVGWAKGAVFAGVFAGPMQKFYRDYCECITALDRQIGRVMKKLDELGIANDTVIVYAGDNGYFWGEHRLIDKRWAYEESIRIPFIVRYPRMIARPGQPVDGMVLNIDLAPTVLSIAGIPVPENMEGRSIVPLLKNPDARWRKAWLYEYFKDFPYQAPQMKAVRTSQYKYIEYEGSKGAELFDIIADPREKKNLVKLPRGREILPEMKRLLKELKAGKEI